VLETLKSHKGQALLCYLAVNWKPFSRSALAGLLWPQMPETAARANLRKTLQRIKPCLPYLAVSRETLTINPAADLWVDASAFDTAVANRMDIRRLQEAASLYQGSFLDGLDFDDLPEFEQWVFTQREHRHAVAIEILTSLISYFVSQSKPTQALEYARQLLRLEPWSEDGYQALMRLYALSGKRSAALRQYEICRRSLAQELDVEPSLETQLLYQQIVDGTLENLPLESNFDPQCTILGTTSNLPPLPTPLIGRFKERSVIKTYLAEAVIRLVSILGPGGIGKTHLALSIAHDIATISLAFGGVIFVPLQQVTTRQGLLAALAEHLNLDLAGDLEKTILNHLRAMKFLIILDNFEQLLPEADLLERILVAAPDCKLLVTSRERLKLRQEWVLDLQGLPYPEAGQESWEGEYDAVQLFATRAKALRGNFSLENNRDAVVRICQTVQGMPLALEMAASWIRTLSAEEIACHIVQNLAALKTDLRIVPERHRAMRAVFDSSWAWLSPHEQHVIMMLSVFKGGFTLQAAEKVAEGNISTLSSLIDKSLLNRAPRSQGYARYHVHELFCQYADEKLQSARLQVTALTRHQDYFLELAEQAERFWDTDEEKEWLLKLEYERGNLHAALDYALETGRVEVLLRLNAALLNFWFYLSPPYEAASWLETALALSWDENDLSVLRARAKALNVAGYSAALTNEYVRAKRRFEEGAAIYERLNDRRGLAWSLRGCGYVALHQGDFGAAKLHIDQSLKICWEIQDEWGTSWSVFDLGFLNMAEGDLSIAKDLLADSLERFRQHGIRFGEYHALIALGFISYTLDEMAQAQIYFRGALVCQQKNSFCINMADALEGLSYIAVASDEYIFAVKLLGAGEKHRQTFSIQRHKLYDSTYDQTMELLHSRMAQAEFNTFWDAGAALSRRQAIQFALTGDLISTR